MYCELHGPMGHGYAKCPLCDAADASPEVDRAVASAKEKLRLSPDLQDSIHTRIDRALLAEHSRANELQASLDLRRKADMRAIELWRAAGEGRELTLPDHADLCVWLLEQGQTSIAWKFGYAQAATDAMLDLTPVDYGTTVDDVLSARGEYDKAMSYRATKERKSKLPLDIAALIADCPHKSDIPEAWHNRMISALTGAMTAPPSAEQRAPVRVPCPNKVDGVCPLPNVHCASPKCTEGTAPLSHVTPAGPPAPPAQAATDDLVQRLYDQDDECDGYSLYHEAAAELQRQAREIAELRATLQRQAAAALRGMDAAKAISSGQLKEARRLHAESNPTALDSERAANAALTERDERAEPERDALRADAERYRWLFDHDDSARARVDSVYRLWDGQSDWRAAIDAARARVRT